MATATKKKKNTAGDGEGEDDKETEAGLVDFNATDVKKVLKRAQKRGFITHDEINQLLPDADMSSDQIEDVMSQISEMGIAVVETEEEAEEQGKALTKLEDKKVLAKKGNARGSDRTDDPVRMYLREMGAVELLSREGEIAIAKRIEAGRDAMIRGLCESPLTFEAMMVWRDELMNERILLRDLIDLEATYGAENPPPEPKVIEEKAPEPVAPAKGKGKRQSQEEIDEVEAERLRQQQQEEEEEDDAAAMSMSAMEGELREGVLAKLDEIAEKLRPLPQAAGPPGRPPPRRQGPDAEGADRVRRAVAADRREPQDDPHQQRAYRGAGRTAVRDQQEADGP